MSKGHHGGGACRHRTAGEKAVQRGRTARNKVKAVRRALATAGGEHVAFLKARLLYWQAKTTTTVEQVA